MIHRSLPPLLGPFVFSLCSHSSAITVEQATVAQGKTLEAMIDELEDSHYVDRRYDDAMSQAHLETYLDNLDPSRLFFTQQEITEFAMESVLDDFEKTVSFPLSPCMKLTRTAQKNGSQTSSKRCPH